VATKAAGRTVDEPRRLGGHLGALDAQARLHEVLDELRAANARSSALGTRLSEYVPERGAIANGGVQDQAGHGRGGGRPARKGPAMTRSGRPSHQQVDV